MGCGNSTPKVPPPESVAFFFNGEAMAGKAEQFMGEYVADDIVLSFIGPYAPPVPPLDKEHMGGAIGNLIASFPDFTFNPAAHAKHVKDPTPKAGGWAANIVVTGKHTGAPFTPMPGKLDAVPTSDKEVTIGPETFTLYTNAEGKVNKITIEPLHKGAPAGPPGFYTEIGGVIPPPEPPKPDCMMMAEVKDFADWHAGFTQHGHSKTFTIAGKEFTVDKTRGEACDEAKTLVFHDEANPNAIAVALYSMDFAAFGPVMESAPFKEMTELAITSQAPPLLMTPPGPSAGATPSMFFWVEVDDVDKWIAGFKAHATSKTVEGVDAPIARGDFVDESKTRIFKCATHPQIVGAYMEGVQMAKLGPLLQDPGFAALAAKLGEKEGTKVMNVVAPMPPPPAATAGAPAA